MPKVRLDVTGEQTLPDVQIPVNGDVKRGDFKVQEVEIHTDMTSFDERAAELAFMEEPVTIHMHETTNPNEELYVFCGVNGEYPTPGNPWLKRGGDYTIKRKFVANLFTAKTVSFTQPFKQDTSDKANYMRPHAAVKYPFSVIADANPKGVAWLKQMMGA